jgi:hypothetical protein
MTDQDREAFEAWFLEKYAPLCAGTRGAWREFSEAKIAGQAWQAARAHAPKLTEAEAGERVARHFALQEYHAHGFETIGSPQVYVDKAWKDHIANAKAALRAAGVRFEEGALKPSSTKLGRH